MAFAQGDKIQGKVTAGDQHEHQRNAFEHGRLEMGKAGVMGRKPAQADRGEHVHDRIQRLHAPSQ